MTELQKANKIRNHRRKINQILDMIGQFRLRAQVAESYGLWAVADSANRAAARFEPDIEGHLSAISRLETN